MDSFQFPAWYQSSAGPGVSKTLFNIVGAFLPMLNMFFQSTGHPLTVLPAEANSWISLAVFAYFSVQAFIGYIRSKQVAESKLKAAATLGGLSAAQFHQITKI